MLHFVIATYIEALPIIKYYKLKQINKISPFNIFVNKNSDISLIISGIGKVASSSAVSFLYCLFKQKKDSIWINLGIAGYGKAKIGEIFLINKISDHITKKNYYPSIVFENEIPTLGCQTYEIPNFNYTSKLHDMELTGFFETATKFSSNELVQSLKVVSDNKENKINKNDKKFISNLISKKINTIDLLTRKLKEISYSNDKDDINPKVINDFTYLTKSFHFSEYQKIELKKNLKKWYVLYKEDSAINYTKYMKNASIILKKIKERL